MTSRAMWRAAAVLATTGVFATSAHADLIKVGGRGGTLGYGGEAGLQLHKRFVLRGSMTRAEINLEETINDIDYDAEIDLGAMGVQADIYPLAGGFYLTGGYFINGNEASLRATPSEGITLGDTVYTPEEVGTLVGDVTFDDTAYFAGLGLTTRIPATPIETFFEGGVYFQGAPEVTYTASGLVANDPTFLADLDAEAAEVQDELAILETYPAINIGLRLSF